MIVCVDCERDDDQRVCFVVAKVKCQRCGKVQDHPPRRKSLTLVTKGTHVLVKTLNPEASPT